MVKNITIFTTNTCAYCSMVKKYLDAKSHKYDVVNLDEQPERQAEAHALSGSLTPDAGPEVKSKTIGPIEIVYQDGAQFAKRYTAVENLLRPYVRGGSNQITLLRA